MAARVKPSRIALSAAVIQAALIPSSVNAAVAFAEATIAALFFALALAAHEGEDEE